MWTGLRQRSWTTCCG